MPTDGTQKASSAKWQLALGTVSFAVCFAAWGLISAFAPRFREWFHLSATQTAFLVAVPVLLGSLMRIVTGMLADRFGGRNESIGLPLSSRLFFCDGWFRSAGTSIPALAAHPFGAAEP